MSGRKFHAFAIAAFSAALSGCALAPETEPPSECASQPTSGSATILFDVASSIDDHEKAFAQAGWRNITQNQVGGVFARHAVNESWVSAWSATSPTEVKALGGNSSSSEDSEQNMSWYVKPLARAFEGVLGQPPRSISYGVYCHRVQEI